MGSIAALFRSPFLERIASGTHIDPILELADHFSGFNPPSPDAEACRMVCVFLYRLLFEHYRCEYVYKNAIATRDILVAALSTKLTDDGRDSQR